MPEDSTIASPVASSTGARQATAGHLLQAGQMVQWYRIDAVLGRGGFGVTYQATDTNLDREVAVKEFLPASLVLRQPDCSVMARDEAASAEFMRGMQRFTAEARVLVKFSHPAIVRVFSVFEANNTAYMVMELERGEPLYTYLQRPESRTEAELRRIVLTVAEGLKQVHQQGYIHRDIKPSNVIVRADGQPVLIDFGSARPTRASAETSFVSAGYTPLEQYQEGSGMEVGPWTDLYALAATLYYAVTGAAPIAAISRLAALAGGLADPLKPVANDARQQYSASFLAAIDNALQFRVEDRPVSVDAWVDMLRQPAALKSDEAAAIESVAHKRGRRRKSTHASSLLGRLPRHRRRWYVLVGSACLVGLAFVGMGEFADRKRIADLTARAEHAMGSEDEIGQALVLYRQLLEADPENSRAVRRIAEINRALESRIRRLLEQRKLDEAEVAISEYAQLAGNASTVRRYSDLLAGERAEVKADAAFAEQLAVARRLLAERKYAEAQELTATLLQQRPLHRETSDLNDRAGRALRNLTHQKRAGGAASLKDERTKEASDRIGRQREAYSSLLSRAADALQDYDPAEAQRLLTLAEGYQIDDARFQSLQQRVRRELAFQRLPMSASEVQRARQQFEVLAQAIRQKNSQAVRQLSEFKSSRGDLYLYLMDRYTQVNVELEKFATRSDPRRATVNLRITDLVLPNGDIVYPSAAYRDSTLVLLQAQSGWSKVRW